MALLQAMNAVFHHPLDDLSETLQTQAWTGTNESFGAGAVSDALLGGLVTATNPNAYTTTVGATKLAFSMWTKEPSAPLTGPPPQLFRETRRNILMAMGLPSSRLGGWT